MYIYPYMFIFGTRFLKFSCFFKYIFVPGRGVGTKGLVRRGSSALCFSTFGPKLELTPLVSEVFRISGFPVPLRARLPIGNLPLSEAPHQRITLTDTEEFRRSSRDEVRRKSGGW